MLNKEFIKEVIECMSKLPFEEVFVKATKTMMSWKGLDEFWDKVQEIEKKSVVSPERQEQFWRLARII